MKLIWTCCFRNRTKFSAAESSCKNVMCIASCAYCHAGQRELSHVGLARKCSGIAWYCCLPVFTVHAFHTSSQSLYVNGPVPSHGSIATELQYRRSKVTHNFFHKPLPKQSISCDCLIFFENSALNKIFFHHTAPLRGQVFLKNPLF